MDIIFSTSLLSYEPNISRSENSRSVLVCVHCLSEKSDSICKVLKLFFEIILEDSYFDSNSNELFLLLSSVDLHGPLHQSKLDSLRKLVAGRPEGPLRCLLCFGRVFLVFFSCHVNAAEVRFMIVLSLCGWNLRPYQFDNIRLFCRMDILLCNVESKMCQHLHFVLHSKDPSNDGAVLWRLASVAHASCLISDSLRS